MAKPYFEIGRYGSVGLELVLTILIPAALGHWLDGRYWHDSGYGVGVGFVIGVVVGFRNLVRTANGMQRDIERAEANDPEAKNCTRFCIVRQVHRQSILVYENAVVFSELCLFGWEPYRFYIAANVALHFL